AKHIVLAVPKGMHVSYDNIDVVCVEPEYPKSVNALLIKEVTGKENPEGVGAVGLHNIWSLGRVGVTGLPLMETVITIGSQTKWANYIVKNGMWIGQLLEYAGIELRDGDIISRGGPLRGECLDRLDRSITKGTTGLFVVESGTVPPMEGHSPCINCGACVQVCPAHLNPSTLSRYAEFANYNACLAEHSTHCLECGLCGYVCIARRPVLQYIRLANAKIKEMQEFVWEENK
ncbi:MAG TPA: electron transporter RnfC, partial [Desulfovibrio sp.]|nr:electron transporter RnfC [Desulfovibrio sp.]